MSGSGRALALPPPQHSDPTRDDDTPGRGKHHLRGIRRSRFSRKVGQKYGHRRVVSRPHYSDASCARGTTPRTDAPCPADEALSPRPDAPCSADSADAGSGPTAGSASRLSTISAGTGTNDSRAPSSLEFATEAPIPRSVQAAVWESHVNETGGVPNKFPRLPHNGQTHVAPSLLFHRLKNNTPLPARYIAAPHHPFAPRLSTHYPLPQYRTSPEAIVIKSHAKADLSFPKADTRSKLTVILRCSTSTTTNLARRSLGRVLSQASRAPPPTNA